jgi:glycosyltransferase involved in cell wall biosynthesis
MVPFDGVPTVFFPRQWSEGLKYSRPLAHWLEEHVADFDVVHVHGIFSHACLAAARAARRHGVPYVVRALGMLDPWSLGRRRLAKRIAWPLGVSRLLAGAAAIHYTTAEEQRLAERLRGLAPGVVIPLGVDHALLEFAPSATGSATPELDGLAGRPYVLALSRLHPKKGLELLVDAFLEVTAGAGSMGRWHLVLAGDGDPRYVAGLRRRARPGNGRVLFPGWLDGPRKHAILAGASLLALPSHQENFGLAAIEALACGVPVLVSTDVNLAGEIRAAGAGWVTPLAPDALRAALGAALRKGSGLASHGAAGRALVRARFTWSRVSAALVDLYGAVSRREPALAVSEPR